MKKRNYKKEFAWGIGKYDTVKWPDLSKEAMNKLKKIKFKSNEKK